MSCISPEMLLDNSTLRIVWMQDSLKTLQQKWYVITREFTMVHVSIHSQYPILIQMTFFLIYTGHQGKCD